MFWGVLRYLPLVGRCSSVVGSHLPLIFWGILVHLLIIVEGYFGNFVFQSFSLPQSSHPAAVFASPRRPILRRRPGAPPRHPSTSTWPRRHSPLRGRLDIPPPSSGRAAHPLPPGAVGMPRRHFSAIAATVAALSLLPSAGPRRHRPSPPLLAAASCLPQSYRCHPRRVSLHSPSRLSSLPSSRLSDLPWPAL